MTTAPDEHDPKCPKCGRKKSVVRLGPGHLQCNKCGIQFDPTDDGDYSDRSPSARMEREDRQREAKRDRLGRR